jgi:hypothetical protein
MLAHLLKSASAKKDILTTQLCAAVHFRAPMATQTSQPPQQFRQGLAEGARQGRNCIEPGLRAPALHLDNCVFREPAVDGEIGKTPAARFAEPLNALAESCLEGLWWARVQAATSYTAAWPRYFILQ